MWGRQRGRERDGRNQRLGSGVAFVIGLVGVFDVQILQIVSGKFDFGEFGHCSLIGST